MVQLIDKGSIIQNKRGSTMKKYKITICHTCYTSTEIEAESEEAAYNAAQDLKWNVPSVEDMESVDPHVYDVVEIEEQETDD